MGFALIPRRWRWLLLASLALNVAVAGLVAGALLQQGPSHKGGRGGGPAALGLFVTALPEDRRAAFDEGRRPDRSRQESRDERRARLEAFLSSLRADPFDAEAAMTILAEHRLRGSDRLASAEAALIETLADMSPAEREKYADRLLEIVRRPGKG